jgi:alkanesulfonate monooxygenase SsuD/methylene tetrahydromethanopterin reductase-like flavin-dependent oxidoreductase (luciferase family)
VVHLGINFDLSHPAHLGADRRATYAAALDMVGWADDLGFDRVSFGEYHQSESGHLPCPLVFAAAVGGRTRRIRIRISILLALLYDPVRLAEEVAVADLLTHGRLELGLGVGESPEHFAAFAKDYHRRGTDLDELIPFLRRAWTGEPFEFRGCTVRVTPRPFQDPMPIHLGSGGSRRAIERAVALADGFFPPAMQGPWDVYRAACVVAGKPDPGAWSPRGPIFLWVTTDDKDQTWQRLAPHIRHQIEFYGGPSTAGVERAPNAYTPTGDRQRLDQGGAYQVVTPAEAIELAERLGPRGELHLNPLLAGIDPAEAWVMLRTFEREVLPHLSTARRPAADRP